MDSPPPQAVCGGQILFFQAVDQAQLGAKAGIQLRPPTLMEFGNPPLGVQFLTAKPEAGLDWPVRLLVYEDEAGAVWAHPEVAAYLQRKALDYDRWLDRMQKMYGKFVAGRR